MKSEDFYYYLHKTTISEPEMIESIFNEGLKSRYYYSMHSTLMPVDETNLLNNGLEAEILFYLGQGEEYNAVVVVKIPKKYFRNRIHRDGKTDPSIPVFREYYEEGWTWNSIFTPKLIQGIYCRDIEKSFSNPNFCPVFDPSGCQFSDEQIYCFDSFNGEDWKKLAMTRRKTPFQQLYFDDQKHNIWESVVSHYSQLYGIIPKQMIKYEMSADEKSLFGKKHI